MTIFKTTETINNRPTWKNSAGVSIYFNTDTESGKQFWLIHEDTNDLIAYWRVEVDEKSTCPYNSDQSRQDYKLQFKFYFFFD